MQEKNNIRNFSIIAHIDHGKSTLADRFLELTATIEKRKMKEQVLDQMELERERGITIKMQPVRMSFEGYQLNLIDTPGHIDFSYEVSRSLKAVEGAVLLVDATQGVQAQTISNLEMAKELGLTIVPVINKIDSPNAQTPETKQEILEILSCEEKDILEVSAKTGEGVEALLKEIISRIPPPHPHDTEFRVDTRNSVSCGFRGLVFDFEYSPHKGIILYVRCTDGQIKKGDKVFLHQAGLNFTVGEIGILSPTPLETPDLKTGEIGYVVTNVKEAGVASVGDTLLSKGSTLGALKGYKQPAPVVWASIYPESQDDFTDLKQSLERLKLSDSSLDFEEEESGVLGRGFRCGFLGMLHLEIIVERLKREFKLAVVVATPSVVYKIEDKNGNKKEIYSAALFPEHFQIDKILEPWVEVKIITPFDKLGEVMQVLKRRDAMVGDTEGFGEQKRFVLKAQMPLREMMNNFFEELKSATSGYASFSYQIMEDRRGELTRLEVLLNEEVIPAFSKMIAKKDMQRDAKNLAEKLKRFLPRALFVIKIQVKANGRIIAAQKISALKKDVTAGLYGGDITRKMKVREKQKKGKKKLSKHGRVDVPHDVFLKMIQGGGND
ncbi:translation elongation factor 4 [Patescibacteria group bacterium]